MKSRMMGAAMLATIAAACGPNAGNAPQQVDQQAATADYSSQLAAMPDGERNAVFIRALRDARLDCQHVDSSERADDYQGMPVWTARCTGGGNWTIVIGANGVAQILNANEARLVTGEGAQTNRQ